ncbi:hypothetical protein L207DRAFT_227422 [Hyaloscypha variabilis F]|uniref:Uncharacterized protein n=1 Tax=Hyaloscypha variabilis (strain UAMH 11265 / GT02V1 / F) TaxID=1149755 RepID=A0A2J6QW31_HYAVF|nr:hypothetical protein L207DRAFT_227422 [Hyaloscypha variabilis F]
MKQRAVFSFAPAFPRNFLSASLLDGHKNACCVLNSTLSESRKRTSLLPLNNHIISWRNMGARILPRWCGPEHSYNYGCYYTLPTAAIIGIVFAGVSIFLLVVYIGVVWARNARRRAYYRNRGRDRWRDEEVGVGAGIRGGGRRERRTREKRSRRSKKHRSEGARRWPENHQ